MRFQFISSGIILLLVTLLSAAQAGEQRLSVAAVQFTDADSYSDFDSAHYRGRQGREKLQQSLQATISELADEYLPAEHSLLIEFTNIDLAGRLVPGHQIANMPGRSIPFANQNAWERIVDRDLPPSMQFNYQLLSATGEVLKTGQVRLQDNAFLSNITSRQRQHFNAELAFETMMLKNWFGETFAVR